MQFSGVVFPENLPVGVMKREGTRTLLVRRLRNSVSFPPQFAEFFARRSLIGLPGRNNNARHAPHRSARRIRPALA